LVIDLNEKKNMETLANDFLTNNFQTSPNNIHSLPGKEWRRCVVGLPMVPHNQQIREIEGVIYIFQDVLTTREEGFIKISHFVVEKFNTVESLLRSKHFTRKVEGAYSPTF
jgi:hypothetical protein